MPCRLSWSLWATITMEAEGVPEGLGLSDGSPTSLQGLKPGPCPRSQWGGRRGGGLPPHPCLLTAALQLRPLCPTCNRARDRQKWGDGLRSWHMVATLNQRDFRTQRASKVLAGPKAHDLL